MLGVNLDPASDAYILPPRAMFIEFLPVDNPQSQPLLARDGTSRWVMANSMLLTWVSLSLSLTAPVTIGSDYALIISNLSGLLRYHLGDVVKVVGRQGEASVVEFLYRQGQLLNVHGEKTSESHLLQALSQTQLVRSGKIVDFTSEECVGDIRSGDVTSYYTIYVELSVDDAPSAVQVAGAVELDAALCKANPVYKSYRDRGSIAPLRLQVVSVRSAVRRMHPWSSVGC